MRILRGARPELKPREQTKLCRQEEIHYDDQTVGMNRLCDCSLNELIAD